MKGLLFAFLLISLLLLFGCNSQSPSQSAAQNASDAGVRQHFTCADGSITTDLSECITCPQSCNDQNPCTLDSCDSQTKECTHVPLDGSIGECSGPSGNCTAKTCRAGACVSIRADSCCGDGIRTSSETCSSCPSDVKCQSNELCCSSGCVRPACKSDSDCYDSVLGTNDKCLSPGTCDAKCENSPIRDCKSNDNVCPLGCTKAADSDCAGGTNGGAVVDRSDFILSLSNPRELSCRIAGRDFYENFILFDVTFENKKSVSYPLKVSDFYSYSHVLGANEEANRTHNSVPRTYDITLNPLGGPVYYGQLPLLSGSDYEPPCDSQVRLSNLLRDTNVKKGDIEIGKVWIKIGQNGAYQNGSWTIGYRPSLSIDNTVEMNIVLG